MATVGIRELSRETSRVIKQFEETGEPLIITRENRPIGVLQAVDSSQLEDLVLATAPEFQESSQRTREAVEAGTTRSLDDLADERGGESSASPGKRSGSPIFLSG